MRFDILSVFPEFFRVLDLSLIGKARDAGLIEVHAHDLREWTHDVHRTVDDSPCGGGAGMVMKPDVWAEAIDTVTGRSAAVGGRSGSVPFVLAIPTPSGLPLKQAMCEQLARTADHVVIACGRYEGIDARVAEYYREQPEVCVFEYSLGDYVLNGGEVAAVALIEAVSRLIPGMVGNPESLVEESHGSAGLLEYPVYTRPIDFRGLGVPSVVMSGDHGAVARWRKDRALEKTALRRPEMIRALSAEQLNKKDIAKLAQLGYFLGSKHSSLTQAAFRLARLDEATSISDLAVRTFPDAAPSSVSEADIQAFIRQHLQPHHFEQILADPQHNVLIVAELLDFGGAPSGKLAGYTWVVIPDGDGVAGLEEGAPVDVVTADGIARQGPLMYLEKAYLDRQWRGTGMAQQMLSATLAQVRTHLAQRTPSPAHPYLWLGTHSSNKRAQRAYKRFGFEYSGRREFWVGEQINEDVTMCLRIDMAQ